MNNVHVRQRKNMLFLIAIKRNYHISLKGHMPSICFGLLDPSVTHYQKFVTCHTQHLVKTSRPTNFNNKLFHTNVTLFKGDKGFVDTNGSAIKENNRPNIDNKKTLSTTSDADSYTKKVSEFEVIYCHKHIVPLQVLTKFKIYQLISSTGLTIYLCWGLYMGHISTSSVVLFEVFNSLILLGLFSASWFIQRIVGLISVNKNADLVKISHLTFWGKRADLFVKPEEILPVKANGKEFIFQIKDGKDNFHIYPNKSSLYNAYITAKLFGKRT